MITVTALDTATVSALRAGGPDANGMPCERTTAPGPDLPCRHCLSDVPTGAGMLILSHRPFPAPQPYAETGPVFLCADHCTRWQGDGLPPIAQASPDYLLKGYGPDDRIVYGMGAVTLRAEIAAYASTLARGDIAYVHVRSARNNCFLFRIDRARADQAPPL